MFANLAKRPADAASYALCALAVLVGVATAVAGVLEGYPYWNDEAFSVALALHPPGEALRHILSDVHPPLHYLLLSSWVKLFGSGETAVRSLSLLGVLGALAMLWWMGRGLYAPLSLAIASAWIASHWIWVFFAQEARVYSWMLMGSTWLCMAFARRWSAPVLSARSTAVFAGGALLVAGLHYHAAALAGVALLMLCWKVRRVPWALAAPVAVGCACIAWAAFHGLYREVDLDVWGVSWLERPAKFLLRLGFPQLLGASVLFEEAPAVAIGLALSVLALLALGVRAYRRLRATPPELAAEAPPFWGAETAFLKSQRLLVGLFVLAVLLVNLVDGFITMKSIAILLPPAALAAGIAVRRLWAGIGRAGILALLLGGSLWVTWEWSHVKRGHHWNRYPHMDRQGMRMAADMAARPAEKTRIYCLHCPALRRRQMVIYTSGGGQSVVSGGGQSVVRVRIGDARHLVPPFFVVTDNPLQHPNVQGTLARLRLRGLHFQPLAGPLRENRVATLRVQGAPDG